LGVGGGGGRGANQGYVSPPSPSPPKQVDPRFKNLTEGAH
jgi:hypothetical protein